MNLEYTKDISIDEMKIDHYKEIYLLWSHTPGMALSNADTYENINSFLQRNKGLSYICKHGDKIIGTVLCGHDGRRGYIYHVTVVEDYRGKGIGLKLVERSLEQLKIEGIEKCHLFVYKDNVIGNSFWKSSGWMPREGIFMYSKTI